MRGDRPSSTAEAVAALRALYTAMPPPLRLVEDPFASELVPAPLALPARLVARAPWLGAAVHRGLGAVSLGLSYHVALRTRAIDDALRAALARGARQLVVLGAGLDSRALRLDELAGARAFEVDHPSTLRYKQTQLSRATRASHMTAAHEVTRVAIDFETQSLDGPLVDAGFDPGAVSFWIWEGVTVYLSPRSIAKTLDEIATLCAPSSRVALTYARLSDLGAYARILPIGNVLGRAIGEPLHGLAGAPVIMESLRRTGLSVISDESTVDLAARYWPSARGVVPWERLLVAERRG